MKKRKPANFNYDFTGLAVEVTGDDLYLINGGAEVENSHQGVANAQVGDTITRSNGQVVTLNQGDIDHAQKQLGISGPATDAASPTPVPEESSNSQNATPSISLPNNQWTIPKETSFMEQSLDKWKRKSNKSQSGKITGLGNYIDLNASENHLYFEKRVSSSATKTSAKDVLIQAKKDNGSIKTWLDKKQGESLTTTECQIQRIWGTTEMIAGPTVGILGCEVTGGESFVTGMYIMADGAVMVAKANEGVKQKPFLFFSGIDSPITGETNGAPVMLGIINPQTFMPGIE